MVDRGPSEQELVDDGAGLEAKVFLIGLECSPDLTDVEAAHIIVESNGVRLKSVRLGREKMCAILGH
jgi:hypothetical protein